MKICPLGIIESVSEDEIARIVSRVDRNTDFADGEREEQDAASGRGAS